MKHHVKASPVGSTMGRTGGSRAFVSAIALCGALLAIAAPSASAAKQVASYFGTESGSGSLGGQFSIPREISVNQTGAGPANAGDIYVVDEGNNRIQRFDSEGHFISAWGTGVLTGGTGYETCAVAADCLAAGETGGNGTAAGNGGFSRPQAIAIDQDSGNVYVSNRRDNGAASANASIGEYDGEGNFIRSFGWDVDATTAGTGFEVCPATDVCKAGVAGAGIGQIGATNLVGTLGIAVSPADGSSATGTVFLADSQNRRVNTYNVDGSAPASFGSSAVFEVSQPRKVAVDSRGIAYASNSKNSGEIERYDTTNANGGGIGFLAPILATNSTPSTGPLLAGSNTAGGAAATATSGLAVDPDSDGGGSDTDVLNVLRDPSASGASTVVQQFGPTNKPGLVSAPSGVDEEHGSGFTAVNGLAHNDADGRLFVSTNSAVGGEPAKSGVYVLDNVTPPTAAMLEVTEVDSFGATFKGEVDPNGSPTNYRFEYSSDGGASWRCLVVESCSDRANLLSAGEGENPVTVTARVELEPDTEYKARLTAIKPYGAGEAVSGATTFSTLPAPPTVLTGYAAPIAITTARLTGSVNPNNHATEAHFEYGTAGPCSSNPCQSTAPEAVGSTYIKPGQPFTPLTAELGDLQPGITYYYRLVATSNCASSEPARVCTGEGADRTFTTLSDEGPGACPNESVRRNQHSASYLPDCRAFELINSPDKGVQHVHAEVEQGTSPMSADGESFVWNVIAGAPGGNTGNGATFLAKRTGASEAAPNGWASQSLIPPAEEQANGESAGFKLDATNPDLTSFLFNSGYTVFVHGKTLMRVDSQPMQATNLHEYTQNVEGKYADMSGDGSHVFFIGDSNQLEDIGSGGAPKTVSIMPDGEPNECGLEGGFQGSADNFNFVGGSRGSVKAAAALWRPGYHMIATSDGSRAYFQAKPNGSDCENEVPPSQRTHFNFTLYQRNLDTNQTSLIDAGAVGPSGFEPPEFIRATPDGREAYFLTRSQLDTADTNSDKDVYRWAEATGESTCLTCAVENENGEILTDVEVSPLTSEGTSAVQSVLVSDDFSHVYFESKKQLVLGHGTAGDLNLYALSDGEVHFVADVNDEGVIEATNARLSTNGDVLLFTTTRESNHQLTPDELAPSCENPGEQLPGPCEELFRYDDRDQSLRCVSCNSADVTEGGVGSPDGVSAGLFFQMSADGGTVAFATSERLVPSDVNGSTDIYEWRDDKVRLITDGVTSFATGLLSGPQVHAVSANGRDIFFSLVAPTLTGFERDGFANLYDARVGGGFTPPPPPPHCEGDSCQGPLQGSPASAQPFSSSFAGAGNLSEGRRRCAKHRVRRHGHCVARHKKHRRRRGAKRAANNDRGGAK